MNSLKLLAPSTCASRTIQSIEIPLFPIFFHNFSHIKDIRKVF